MLKAQLREHLPGGQDALVAEEAELEHGEVVPLGGVVQADVHLGDEPGMEWNGMEGWVAVQDFRRLKDILRRE